MFIYLITNIINGICADILREQEIRIRAEERARAVRIIGAHRFAEPETVMSVILDEGVG